MSTLFQAALLGVVQGLTEFLPVSSTAHLLIGERLLGFSGSGQRVHRDDSARLDSRHHVAVSREDSARWSRGCRRDLKRGDLRSMLFIAFLPAVIAAALASDYVETVLHKSIPVMAAAFIARRHRDAAWSSGSGRGPPSTRIDDVTVGQAAGIGLYQMLALVPGRVALGCDDRRRHADGARSADGGRVFVLSGDADLGGRLRAQRA